MLRILILTVALACGLLIAETRAAGNPTETVQQAEQVLGEIMAIPGKQIPQWLLADAQGVAIIPNVIKIGFIAGGRRGHGVVMVRDADGEWSLPQFITLTGGSIGWQAGIQGTDVVLVFTTRKGIDGLMNGKFTIGADASAAAGPIGRNAAAATDSNLKAEILSYSRSRGLFLGVSIDGSALEIDQESHTAFYGSTSAELPRYVPPSAAQLRNYLTVLAPRGPVAPVVGEQRAVPEFSAARADLLRRTLSQHSTQLQAILSPEWRHYLALPKEVSDPTAHPSVEALVALQQRFALVGGSPNYAALAQRTEFQSTQELLREYTQALSATPPALQLPPPPVK